MNRVPKFHRILLPESSRREPSTFQRNEPHAVTEWISSFPYLSTFIWKGIWEVNFLRSCRSENFLNLSLHLVDTETYILCSKWFSLWILKASLLVLVFDIILFPSLSYVTLFLSGGFWDLWLCALIWVPPTPIHGAGSSVGHFNLEAHVLSSGEFSCVISLLISFPNCLPPVVHLFALCSTFPESSSTLSSNFTTKFLVSAIYIFLNA